MSRIARKIALQAEIETTYGGGMPDGVTWADALQILPRTRPQHRIERMNEPRDLYTPYLGASDEIPGPRVQVVEFEVELAGSGTAGTAPPWGKLLRACQFAEAVFTSPHPRVEYTPVTTPGESLVIRYWADGIGYVARGCRGTVRFDLSGYKIPRALFTFKGFDTSATAGGPSQPANPYAAWKTPVLPMSTTAGNIRLGVTYAPAGFSGGTAYPSKGFTLDLGDEVTYDAILGGEKIVLTDRQPKGEFTLDLTAAQEVTWRNEVNTSTETTFGWQLGNTAGNIVQFFGRRLQRRNPQQTEDNGFLRIRSDFGLILDKDDPNDDFMRIVVR
jgi:hypothetical protein